MFASYYWLLPKGMVRFALQMKYPFALMPLKIGSGSISAGTAS